MNDFIEVHRLLAIALRRWWLVVLFTALTGAAGFISSRQQAPVYEATTTILVGQSIKSSQLERVDIQTSEALVQTYVDIARRQPVLDGVVKTLNLNGTWLDLRKRIEVVAVTGTQLIEIKVEANSPETALIIADEIANQLLLISPSNAGGIESDPVDTFNHEQILSLQEKIVTGQRRLEALEVALDGPLSEAELARLQNEKIILEGLIAEWGRNYTELLPFTISQPERDPNQLTIIESAHAENTPVRPRVLLNTLLGGGVGMALALLLIIVLEFLDDTYKSPNDFSRSENPNILGSIRRIQGKKYSGQIVAHLNPRSPITETYRIMRSRILFGPAGDEPARFILVTSSMHTEGKSITTANLGIVFAQANLKTVIVDADLRQPTLHRYFRVENNGGLGNLLSSADMNIEDCLKSTEIDNLRILTSGKDLLDPSERLGSARMTEIMARLNEIADIVIFDSPPVLEFADAVDLSRRMDGVIMVIRAGKSKRDAVNQALFDLENAGANLLGSIFTDSPRVHTASRKGVSSRAGKRFSLASLFMQKASGERAGAPEPTAHDEPVLASGEEKRELPETAMRSGD